jgi:hypothetical protein
MLGQSGIDTAVGAGSLLAVSVWRGHGVLGAAYDPILDETTIERVEPDGTLVPLSTTPGPYSLLDADDGRIVAAGARETWILDGASGAILLALPVPTVHAQLSGRDLVLRVGETLQVYDAATGELRRTWQIGAPFALGDVARGLAAYTRSTGGDPLLDDVEVHLLRLGDGADVAVGYGSTPRFLDSGLVYADGARIRYVPWTRLPLQPR